MDLNANEAEPLVGGREGGREGEIEMKEVREGEEEERRRKGDTERKEEKEGLRTTDIEGIDVKWVEGKWKYREERKGRKEE